MNLIDTHCHINLNAFKDDAEEVIQRTLDAGITIINASTQIDTSRQAVALLNKFPEGLYAAVGLHPVHTFKHQFHDEEETSFKTREEVFDYEEYKKLASNPRVVGIGDASFGSRKRCQKTG
jgi:TatD DNase family protein